MFDDNVYAQIDSFVNGELQGEALASFKQAMANNPELKLEVSILQDLAEGIRKHARLKERLKQIDKATQVEDTTDHIKTPSSTGKVKRLYIMVAAAAAILIAVFGLFHIMNEAKTSEQLFVESYEPLQFDDSLRSTDSSTSKTILDEATEAYNSGQYDKALSSFEKSPIDYPLYKGISLLELKRYDEAILQFDKIIAQNREETVYALWYKALTFLKKDDQAQMRATLELLLKQNNVTTSLRKKAEKLL